MGGNQLMMEKNLTRRITKNLKFKRIIAKQNARTAVLLLGKASV